MKRLAEQTLYEILEVPEDAPPAEILAACERACSLYGPGSLATYTLMTPEEAELLTSRIEEARITLLDPVARARYDEKLQLPIPAATGPNGAGASLESLPPVIPAARPAPEATPEPPGVPESAPAADVPMARPAVLLAAAVGSAGSPGEPAQKPIRLEREICQEPPPAPSPPKPPPERFGSRAGSRGRDEPVPVPTPPEGCWTGDALRQVREARGITIAQIAERTKVTRHHIENIEGERFGALPAPVYLRGILLAMARELRLDGQKVARSYLERAAAAKPT